jgi:hypothetical protein
MKSGISSEVERGLLNSRVESSILSYRTTKYFINLKGEFTMM